MEQNKDQSNAAVRGEAVAEFTYKGPDGRFLDSGEWWVENSEIGNHMALPILRNGKTIALVFSEAHDDCKQEIEENCRLLCSAGNSARAADALDSQPTEPVADVQARVRDAVVDNLTSLYHCGRTWSAWSVGTMSEDDFSPAAESEEITDNITDAVMEAFSSQPTDGGVRNG